MYLLSNEGLYIGQTYGTAVVLLVLVLVINGLSGLVAGKLAKQMCIRDSYREACSASREPDGCRKAPGAVKTAPYKRPLTGAL